MPLEVNQNRTEILVGFFVVLAVIYLVYAAVGKWNVLDTSGYTLYADFESVSGLHLGDPVEIAGVEVGVVESISLADYQTRVAFSIRDKVSIREDAIASIELEGLMGDRSVSIDPGMSGNSLGPGGQIVRTRSPRDFQFLLGRMIAGDILPSE
jgi:phospholipid/cholesterol/gamma-HCH transport system substrate-binding protein